MQSFQNKPPDPLFGASAHIVNNTSSGIGTKSNSILELSKEMKQVLVPFGMFPIDAGEVWNLVKERASKG